MEKTQSPTPSSDPIATCSDPISSSSSSSTLASQSQDGTDNSVSTPRGNLTSTSSTPRTLIPEVDLAEGDTVAGGDTATNDVTIANGSIQRRP